MGNLNQLWADEMNGKVEKGTYRKELLKQYPPPIEEAKMDEKATCCNLICYAEKVQFEARIKELEEGIASLRESRDSWKDAYKESGKRGKG